MRRAYVSLALTEVDVRFIHNCRRHKKEDQHKF